MRTILLYPQQITGTQNVLPLSPSSFFLLDEDALHIAQQTKAIIREDVEQIVTAAVAAVAAETDKLHKEIQKLRQSVARLQEGLETAQIRPDDQYSR